MHVSIRAPALSRPRGHAGSVRVALGLVLVGAALWLGRAALLSAIGSFLVVEDPLHQEQAIVVLNGSTPEREEEAARLYQAGWAPRVVLTRGAPPPDASTDRALVLEHLGVPAAAITIVDSVPIDTREETDVLAQAIQPGNASVILVTSPYHTRRAGLAWWQTTGGRSSPILRPAWQDAFDVHSWWHSAPMRAHVLHEYLGLVAYAFGLHED